MRQLVSSSRRRLALHRSKLMCGIHALASQVALLVSCAHARVALVVCAHLDFEIDADGVAHIALEVADGEAHEDARLTDAGVADLARGRVHTSRGAAREPAIDARSCAPR
jgi:hypothetical protein